MQRSRLVQRAKYAPQFAIFDDAEFEKLHAAIRLILPIIPALSASSPILKENTPGIKMHGCRSINQSKRDPRNDRESDSGTGI